MIGKLADPATYPSLKHGYARGLEALQLVDNVRNYYDILARMESRDGPDLPLADAAAQASSKGSAAAR